MVNLLLKRSGFENPPAPVLESTEEVSA